MESEKEEDSFAKGMEDLNRFADSVFKSDLRAQRQKELLDRQVQAAMNAQIANLQQTQLQLVQQNAQIVAQAAAANKKLDDYVNSRQKQLSRGVKFSSTASSNLSEIDVEDQQLDESIKQQRAAHLKKREEDRLIAEREREAQSAMMRQREQEMED